MLQRIRVKKEILDNLKPSSAIPEEVSPETTLTPVTSPETPDLPSISVEELLPPDQTTSTEVRIDRQDTLSSDKVTVKFSNENFPKIDRDTDWAIVLKNALAIIDDEKEGNKLLVSRQTAENFIKSTYKRKRNSEGALLMSVGGYLRKFIQTDTRLGEYQITTTESDTSEDYGEDDIEPPMEDPHKIPDEVSYLAAKNLIIKNHFRQQIIETLHKQGKTLENSIIDLIADEVIASFGTREIFFSRIGILPSDAQEGDSYSLIAREQIRIMAERYQTETDDVKKRALATAIFDINYNLIHTGQVKIPPAIKERFKESALLLDPPMRDIKACGQGLYTYAFVISDMRGKEIVIKVNTLSPEKRSQYAQSEQAAVAVYGTAHVSERTKIADDIHTQEPIIQMTSFSLVEKKGNLERKDIEMIRQLNEAILKGEIPSVIQERMKEKLGIYKQLLFLDLWAKIQGYLPDYQFIQNTSIPINPVLSGNTGIDSKDSVRNFDFDAAHLDLFSADARKQLGKNLATGIKDGKVAIVTGENGRLQCSDWLKNELQTASQMTHSAKRTPVVLSNLERLDVQIQIVLSGYTSDNLKRMNQKVIEAIAFGAGTPAEPVSSSTEWNETQLKVYSQHGMNILKELQEIEGKTETPFEQYINDGLKEIAQDYL